MIIESMSKPRQGDSNRHLRYTGNMALAWYHSMIFVELLIFL